MFYYMFDTDDATEVQAEGGNTMIRFQRKVKDVYSPVYRGLLIRELDPAFGVRWCNPIHEICDPDFVMDFRLALLYASIIGFGSQIIFFLCWEMVTCGKRWNRYKERVIHMKHAQES